MSNALCFAISFKNVDYYCDIAILNASLVWLLDLSLVAITVVIKDRGEIFII
jgi:hypothetical protein